MPPTDADPPTPRASEVTAAEAPATRPASATPPTLQRMHGGLTVLVVIAVVGGLYFAQPFLLPITAALLLSFLLRPVVGVLRRGGLPRWAGALSTLLMIVLLLLGSGTLLVGPITRTLQGLPQTVEVVKERLAGISDPLARFTTLLDEVGSLSVPADGKLEPLEVQVQSNELLATVVGNTGAAAVGLVLAVILAFFLVASDERVLLRAARMLPGLEDRGRATHALRQLETEVSRYLVTLTLINLAVALAMTAAAWWLGVPRPWLMGLIAGIFNYVPYIGPIAALALIGVSSLLVFESLGQALLPPLAFVTINFLEAYIVSPLIYGERLQLNSVVIIVGLTFFTWIWGIAGSVMAVPLLVCVRVTCAHIPRWQATAVMLGPVRRAPPPEVPPPPEVSPEVPRPGEAGGEGVATGGG